MPLEWENNCYGRKRLVLLSTGLRLEVVRTLLKIPIAETLTSSSRDESSINNAVNIHFLFVWNEDMIIQKGSFRETSSNLLMDDSPLLACLLAVIPYRPKPYIAQTGPVITPTAFLLWFFYEHILPQMSLSTESAPSYHPDEDSLPSAPSHQFNH